MLCSCVAANAPTLLLFVYGLQSPRLAFFLAVSEVDVILPGFAAEQYDRHLIDTWASRFDVGPGSYIFSDDGEFDDGATVWIQTDVVLLEGLRAVTDSGWVPMNTVLESLPKVKLDTAEKTSTTRRKVVDSTLLEQEPWLLDYLRRPQRPHADRLASSSALAHDVSDDVFDKVEEVVDLEEVFKELEAMRAEVSERASAAKGPFGWTVLGGAWTKLHKEVSFDAFQARCLGSETKAFCKRFGMNQTCRFSLLLFGEAHAAVLCDYWVAKMCYFYALWQASDCPEAFEFRPQEVAAFVEPIDFTAMAAVAGGQLAARVLELRALAPVARAGID